MSSLTASQGSFISQHLRATEVVQDVVFDPKYVWSIKICRVGRLSSKFGFVSAKNIFGASVGFQGAVSELCVVDRYFCNHNLRLLLFLRSETLWLPGRFLCRSKCTKNKYHHTSHSLIGTITSAAAKEFPPSAVVRNIQSHGGVRLIASQMLPVELRGMFSHPSN